MQGKGLAGGKLAASRSLDPLRTLAPLPLFSHVSRLSSRPLSFSIVWWLHARPLSPSRHSAGSLEFFSLPTHSNTTLQSISGCKWGNGNERLREMTTFAKHVQVSEIALIGVSGVGFT